MVTGLLIFNVGLSMKNGISLPVMDFPVMGREQFKSFVHVGESGPEMSAMALFVSRIPLYN